MVNAREARVKGKTLVPGRDSELRLRAIILDKYFWRLLGGFGVVALIVAPHRDYPLPISSFIAISHHLALLKNGNSIL